MSKIPDAFPSGYSQIVMFALICHKERTVADVAKIMTMEYNSVGTTLHRLVKKGLVKRKYPVNLGKHRVYCLTEAGIEARDFLGIVPDPERE